MGRPSHPPAAPARSAHPKTRGVHPKSGVSAETGMEQIGGGEWRLADRPWRLAHSYTLQAVKQD